MGENSDYIINKMVEGKWHSGCSNTNPVVRPSKDIGIKRPSNYRCKCCGIELTKYNIGRYDGYCDVCEVLAE